MTDADGLGANPEHLNADTCTDIVAGFASRALVDRALDHIRTCPVCEMRLMAAGGDLESIRAKPAPAGWGSPVRPQSDRAHERPVGASSRTRILWLGIPLALAAALLIVFLTDLPRTNRTTDSQAYWIPATGELVRLRGSHSWDADSAFWTGLNAYEAHDTARARELLRGAKASGGLEDLRRLYLASTLVNAAQGQAALKLLDDLQIEDLPLPWREDSYWMKFRALTLLHRSSEAETLLDQMVGWPGRVGDLARQARTGGIGPPGE